MLYTFRSVGLARWNGRLGSGIARYAPDRCIATTTLLSCRCNTTVRSIPSDPRTQTTVPACQTDHFDHSIRRKPLILKSLCQSFVLCRAMTGLFRPPHQPRAPRGKAMGHVVYKPLLGAADTSHPLSTHKWIMFGNVQQLIHVRKWLSMRSEHGSDLRENR